MKMLTNVTSFDANPPNTIRDDTLRLKHGGLNIMAAVFREKIGGDSD